MGKIITTVGGAILALFGIMIFFMTYYTVDEYERVVLTRFGVFQSVEGPGLHFKAPFVNEIQRFSIGIQDTHNDKIANTYTLDNQEVDVYYKVLWQVPPENLKFIYINAQGYKTQLQSIILDRIKREMGKVNMAHVSEHRGELILRIHNVLVEDAKILGVKVIDTQLPNLEFTESFRKAVDAASAAKANVETRNQEWEQAKAVAETVRTKARGDADSRVLAAEAEAKAIKLKGEAEAAAIKAQAEALAQNANLTELRKAERWNGQLPSTMLSNTTPFMRVDKDGIVPRQ